MTPEVPDIHVIPLEDMREHTESRDCWCQPTCTKREDDEAMLVVHTSMDGRELVERYGLQ
jgi:hypothetical protein